MNNTSLKLVRLHSCKTQKQVANAAGITMQAYQRYEYGITEPSVYTAIKIADVFGIVDLRELFDSPTHNKTD